MYYSAVQVVFQEVPNEISLAISISGCQLKCSGCHSAFTWDDTYGKQLTLEILSDLINKYKGYITCLIFYGGEWELDTLTSFLNIAVANHLKTCLYTGLEISDFDNQFLKSLSYIKTGRYNQQLGGLNSTKTNQKFYKLSYGNIIEDLTTSFTQ